MKLRWIAAMAMSFGLTNSGIAQTCTVTGSSTFAPQGKRILLLKTGADRGAVFFRTGLRVNTDGAPNSYHPMDPRGATKAINNIANGVAISLNGKSLKYADTIRVFEEWRDGGWRDLPGYKISWKNVLAARSEGSRSAPCTFSKGEFSGYFVSLTAWKNKLPADQAGECAANDQLDERVVPALVLAGGQTPMRAWGVQTGDLVLARNPSNNVTVAALIGDTGPEGNLGEGSVALNMALLERKTQPQNYDEAKKLDTGNTAIDVAIFPGTANYKWESPVNAINLQARIDRLLQERKLPGAVDAMKSLSECASKSQK
jgi:hypothetical protein